jgi:hypothetical protein
MSRYPNRLTAQARTSFARDEVLRDVSLNSEEILPGCLIGLYFLLRIL